ncbi:DUF4352 domain-containing protein [Streptomyces longwoodensis]|uniref:DUF4352 domain-containing protein n=1 Tax=Streptomyces longwoodensis TaxID=68231 RepID=UPI0033C6532C
MKTRTAACAALLAATAALTACSSEGEPKTIRVTVTQTVTASPAVETAKAPGGLLEFGTKADVTDDTTPGLRASVQALRYTQPVTNIEAPSGTQGGDIWAAADVKVCNAGTVDFSVSQFPWHLTYTDGTNIEVTGSTGGDMPKPEFPMDRTIRAGSCARGKIAFPVPSGKRPERLVYEPEGAAPVEWAVPRA